MSCCGDKSSGIQVTFGTDQSTVKVCDGPSLTVEFPTPYRSMLNLLSRFHKNLLKRLLPLLQLQPPCRLSGQRAPWQRHLPEHRNNGSKKAPYPCHHHSVRSSSLIFTEFIEQFNAHFNERCMFRIIWIFRTHPPVEVGLPCRPSLCLRSSSPAAYQISSSFSGQLGTVISIAHPLLDQLTS